ncbi:MAG: hypothetical protein JNJ56_04005 [Ignavibacteria bacterium]|nr:hypothetical protein [Ignavibacteria bacterium]
MTIRTITAILFYLLFITPDSVFSGPINRVTNKQIPAVDSTGKDTVNSPVKSGSLGIDTIQEVKKPDPVTVADTVKKIDSALVIPEQEDAMTNTRLFIYILLTVLGAGLFFFIFVINLFKTFHRKKSTRQSLLLSWNLFFVVTILWIFIVWGLLAGFWTSSSFMVVVIFLFIISLTMTIIAVKSA